MEVYGENRFLIFEKLFCQTLYRCNMKLILTLTLFILCSLTITAQLKNKHVLIFTKNGKGYVHENIPASIAALQKLGVENNFKVDTTTNSALFTEENLKKYDAIIFSNTNNDVF